MRPGDVNNKEHAVARVERYMWIIHLKIWTHELGQSSLYLDLHHRRKSSGKGTRKRTGMESSSLFLRKSEPFISLLWRAYSHLQSDQTTGVKEEKPTAF
jgi:hypothetical protein